MKKRLLSLLLAMTIPLSGCASVLERDHVSVTPHKSTTTDAGSSSALRVESYQELVNSLSYLVSAGAEAGVIRLYMEPDQAEEDLRAARLEVLQEYPLAVYAVNNITFETDPVLTFTEADVSLSYCRTPQQISSIVSVIGVAAVQAALSTALSQFSPECVLRVNRFERDEDYVHELVRQAYYSNPGAALEYPEVEVYIHPIGGRQPIVEVLFSYQTDSNVLSERMLLLEQATQRTAQALTDAGPVTPSHMIQAVLDQCDYDAHGGSTAYSALLEGSANSEGLALALACLGKQVGLPTQVARGIYNGQPHFWNVIFTEQGWRHVDLSRGQIQKFSTDDQWEKQGYLWLENALPPCA